MYYDSIYMNPINAIDFNLIKYLEALLRLKGVTKAANEVGITQPAMSNALARLRDQFNDPLLVRTKSGYELSSKAEQLQPKIELILQSFEGTFFHNNDFDPTQANISFNGMISDTAGFLIAAKLQSKLHASHPNITVNLSPYTPSSPLEQFDFAIT